MEYCKGKPIVVSDHDSELTLYISEMIHHRFGMNDSKLSIELCPALDLLMFHHVAIGRDPECLDRVIQHCAHAAGPPQSWPGNLFTNPGGRDRLVYILTKLGCIDDYLSMWATPAADAKNPEPEPEPEINIPNVDEAQNMAGQYKNVNSNFNNESARKFMSWLLKTTATLTENQRIALCAIALANDNAELFFALASCCEGIDDQVIDVSLNHNNPTTVLQLMGRGWMSEYGIQMPSPTRWEFVPSISY